MGRLRAAPAAVRAVVSDPVQGSAQPAPELRRVAPSFFARFRHLIFSRLQAAVGIDDRNISGSNGQACFWFSNGCAIGCDECDGSTRGPIPSFTCTLDDCTPTGHDIKFGCALHPVGWCAFRTSSA